MTRPHDDSDPIEHDPTGMRALLGNLPDPGPMPTELVARIEAALADEARARGGWAAPACPDELRADEEGHRSTVFSLPVGDRGRSRDAGAAGPGRSRRSPWQVLGVAAAAVGVLGLGGLVVDGMTRGGVQASLGVADDSGSADSAGGAQAPRELSPESGTDFADGGVLADDPALRVRVLGGVATLAPADTSALAGVAGGLASYPAEAAASAEEAQAPPAGEVTDPGAARACATSLGVPTGDQVVVTLALLDEQPAAVLLATGPSGTQTAWAVTRTCADGDADGDADVLSGPVTLP